MTQTLDELSRRDPRARRLAALVAGAVRVEPALVRAARLKFLPDSDPGLEADVWLSDIVEHRGPSGLVLDATAASQLRAELARDDPSLYEAARALVVEMHAHLPRELRLEEEVAYLEHCALPDRRELIDGLLKRAIAALRDPAREGLARWAARALPRFSNEILARHDARLLAEGSRARLRGSLSGEGDREGELSPWIAHVVPDDLPKVPVVARLFPGMLELVVGESREGGVTLDVPATDPIVLELRSFPLRGVDRAVPGPRRIQLPLRGSRVLAVERGRVELRTLLGERHVLRPEPEVFLSYAFADEEWATRIAQALRARGVRVEPETPAFEMEGERLLANTARLIERAGAFVTIISAEARHSEWTSAVDWPRILERSKRDGAPIFALPTEVPLRLAPRHSDPFPDGNVIDALQLSSLQGLPEDRREPWLAELTERIAATLFDEPERTAASSRLVVDVSRLPDPVERFYGRDAELGELDRAWNENQQRVVALLGPGGSGKTALLREWLRRLEGDGWREADFVFAWTFEEPSVQAFVESATHALGIESSTQDELFTHLTTLRWLVVLDVEPGRGIDHPSFLSLIERLAALKKGMIILSARYTEPSVPLFVVRVVENLAAQKIVLGALREADALSLVLTHAHRFAPESVRDVRTAVGADTALLVAIAPELEDAKPWDVHVRLERALAACWPDYAARFGLGEEFVFQGWNLDHLSGLLALFRGPVSMKQLAELAQRDVVAPWTQERIEGLRVREIPAALSAGWLTHDAATDTIELHPVLRAALRSRLRARASAAWVETQTRVAHWILDSPLVAQRGEVGMAALLTAVLHLRDAGDIGGARSLYEARVALEPAHWIPARRLQSLYELGALALPDGANAAHESDGALYAEEALLLETSGFMADASFAWLEARKYAGSSALDVRTATALLAAGKIDEALKYMGTAVWIFSVAARVGNGKRINWLPTYASAVLRGDSSARTQFEQKLKEVELSAGVAGLTGSEHGDRLESIPILAIDALINAGAHDAAAALLHDLRGRAERLRAETDGDQRPQVFA